MNFSLKIILGATAALAVIVTLFVVPGHAPEPHGVPVAVAGPAPQPRGDALELVQVSDPRAAVLDREAYGALLPADKTLLIATAASPPVAQALQRAFPDMEVQDLKPLDPDDPRGATLSLMMLPLIVVALPLALLLTRERLPGVQLAATVLAFAVPAGFTVAAIAQGLIGALPGNYFAVSGVAALLVAAVAMFATGLARVLGPPGIGLAALVVLLVGNPASGAASAPELLPDFWRQVGPLLPPGAGATALRNVAYFDGAALTTPLLVLAAFAAAGAALMLMPRPRPAARP